MKTRYIAIAAALAFPLANSAFAAIAGPAADYNVFIFGSGNFVSQNTDTMGNLAAGGNVNLMNYAVAQGIAGNPSQSPNPARLVVGGQLTAQYGGVGSSGVGSNQDGTIYYQNAADVPLLTGFTANGGEVSQTLVNFSAAASQYASLSAYLGTLTANGTTATSSGNTLDLTGTSSGLNVFTLAGSTLTSSVTVNISAPSGSTVLINVTGTDSASNPFTFQNGSVFENGVSDASVIYNFYQAAYVDLAGSKDPMGSILAPLAGVTGSYGAMDGQLIAGSYSGNTQFDAVSFTGNLPAPVPLPATGWLLVSALGGLFGWTRRRRVLRAS